MAKKLANNQSSTWRRTKASQVLVGLGCTGVETEGSTIHVHGIDILCTQAVKSANGLSEKNGLDLFSAVNAYRRRRPLMIASTRKRQYTVDYEDIPVVVRLEDLARLIAHSQELDLMKDKMRRAAINLG